MMNDDHPYLFLLSAVSEIAMVLLYLVTVAGCIGWLVLKFLWCRYTQIKMRQLEE